MSDTILILRIQGWTRVSSLFNLKINDSLSEAHYPQCVLAECFLSFLLQLWPQMILWLYDLYSDMGLKCGLFRKQMGVQLDRIKKKLNWERPEEFHISWWPNKWHWRVSKVERYLAAFLSIICKSHGTGDGTPSFLSARHEVSSGP